MHEVPWIQLEAAQVQLGRTQALVDVDLAIHPGERIALVGANGSGKTTLLRALHGLLPLQAGRRVAASGDGEPSGPRLAMVFQRPFLLRLSVRANLSLALWLARVPQRERADRVADALARVGLSELADRQATALSGGQQQRLALARAWALRPQVLLLDEPTASLDPRAKHEIETLVEDFAAQGRAEGVSLVMASHNLGQVKRLATRVVYLERGSVLADVPTETFFHGVVPPPAAQFLKGELPW